LRWGLGIALALACLGISLVALSRSDPAREPSASPPPRTDAQGGPAATKPKLREARIVASPRGSDRAGAGTSTRPYRTLSKAASVVRPGDTVYARAGTFGPFVIKRSGTPRRPITFRPYPGEKASITGPHGAPSRTRAAVAIYGSHVRLMGFDIENPSGRGISALNVRDLVVKRNRVHATWSNPIIATGHRVTIEGNVVSDGITSNRASDAVGFWPAAIGTWSRRSGEPSSNVVIRDNHIHKTWGEGIVPAHARDVLIAGNVVHDTWSANIYLTEVRDVVVERNYLYSTGARFNRNGRAADGIVISNEGARTGGSPDKPFTRDVLIRNNIVWRAGYGIWFWYDPSRNTNNAYGNVRVVHNMVKDTARKNVLFMKVPPSQARPTGNVLENNVLWGATSLADSGSWMQAGNWYAETDGDPKLVGPGGGGPVGEFRPRDDSPLIGAGVYSAEAPRDMSGARRANPPTIGAFEAPR
jgi:hypothetical protein